MIIAKRILFSGRVQGVGFRFTACRIARRRNLSGFVRNLHDGRVEMLAQGAPTDIENCLREITEAFGGYIKQTDIQAEPEDPEYSSFEITF
ncbi:MAG: acylphosphatase [Planctomycetota bacterium]